MAGLKSTIPINQNWDRTLLIPEPISFGALLKINKSAEYFKKIVIEENFPVLLQLRNLKVSTLD
jgi:hypothetical protein